MKAATVAKGAAGLALTARLVMRIPHGPCSPSQPASFPPVFPQPVHPQGLEGKAELWGRGQALTWLQLLGPDPGGPALTGAGGKQTVRPVQGRQEQAWHARSGPNLVLCPAHPTGGQRQSPGTSINGEWDGGLRALTYVTGIMTWALPASAPS